MARWLQRLEEQTQRLLQAQREGRTMKIEAREYCVRGIGRDPRSGLMYGSICFFRKSNALRYLRNVNKRDRAQLGHDTHMLETRIVQREVPKPKR